MNLRAKLVAALALTGSLVAAEAFAQSSVLPGAINQDPRSTASLQAGTGIWKAVVPPTRMAGAFDDNDPIGVITGRRIPADCSINWTDPDSHRLFCFSSATSLVYFLTAPKANTARAEKSWRMLKGTPTG
ncbi:MAG TPA: hypothetical protein VKV77_04300 [Methylovirgula sp.]|nr:hypothetical protein [Methylovirgula sp.]